MFAKFAINVYIFKNIKHLKISTFKKCTKNLICLKNVHLMALTLLSSH